MHKFIDGSPQLIHWKYIDKWRENGKWKYRYASDEKKASSGGLLSNIKKAASDVASTISKTTSTISKKVSDTISNVSKSISSSLTKISEIPKKLVDSGKTFVDNALKKFSKNEIVTNSSTDYKYIAKVYLGDDKWRYFYDEKEYANYLNGKGFIDSLLKKFDFVDEFSFLSKKETETSIEEDLAEVSKNSKNNDAYSAIAYDLRRRGYDVEAINFSDKLSAKDVFGFYGEKVPKNNSSISGLSDKQYADLTGDERSVDFDLSWMGSKLKGEGSDSRGFICVTNSDGTEKIMNWENRDGVVYIIDSQKNKMMEWSDFRDKTLKEDYKDAKSITYIQTDRSDISEIALKYVQNKQNASPTVSPETPAIEDKPDTNRMVDIGKKITEAIKNIGNKEPRNSPEDHTYVAKIFTGDGQYRYFYSEEEYEKYLEGDIEMDVKKTDYEKLVERVVAVDKGKVEVDYFENVPKKTANSTAEEDLKVINENYNPENIATSNNCAYCSVAYDLRRRGYDVEAVEYESVLNRYNMYTLYGLSTSEISDLKNYSDASDLARELEKYGEGARGVIGLTWKTGNTGHAVNWEVINGTAYLIDSQNGFMAPIADGGRRYIDRAKRTDFIRTDNVEPSEDVLRYVQINDDD